MSSTVNSTTRKSSPSEQPLIVAAYLHGDPSRKRRVKVPLNIKWKEFLALFYSRLDLSPDFEIEIFDEKGIEIVSVDDLVENDVLVVREKRSKSSRAMKRSAGGEHSLYTEANSGSNRTSTASVVPRMSHDPSDATPSLMIGMPGLNHFIQSNSFGYYFLAEVENMKMLPGHGRIKKTHCVIKVPLCDKGTGTLQTFENEANLLRKIASHKCIVSSPTVQIINFSDDNLQAFYKSLPQGKRRLVQDLFHSGSCLESYMYPLYGVTMATKIRTGLTPEKVLKYSYQLADVMQFLQQRGVIHLNLLPENIQVMSNDRLILCNFETAVQTDPTTCLLVVSQTVIAPSNKKGLAPEVISALSRLRIETETVDYSTQYPWSFGLLSVVMATGQHPLKDYPDVFESTFRVKYRSHHFQFLPDPEQYPPIFYKLVKRSLSCDPVRRPTLPQILSIIKKDNKILSIMTRGRLGRTSAVGKGGASDGVTRAKQDRSPFDPIDAMEQSHPSHTSVSKPNMSPSQSRGFHETHPPPSYGFQRSASDDAPNDHVTRHKLPRAHSQRYSKSYESHDQATRSHDQSVTSHDQARDPYLQTHRRHPDSSTRSHDKATNQTSDPFLPPKLNTRIPTTATNKSDANWDTFSEENRMTHPLATPLSNSGHDLAIRRQGSQGTFSDNFVSPQISRESSGRTVKQGVSPSSLSVELLQGRVRGVAISESDLSQMQEVPYQRLVQSPVAGNSSDDHPSPTPPHTSDQERLVRASSPENEQEYTRQITNKEEEFTGMGSESIQAVSKRHTPELLRAKVSRSSSYRRATKDGEINISSPLIVRRCFSDETAQARGQEDDSMDTSETLVQAGAESMDIPEPILSLLANTDGIKSHDHHMTSQEYESQSHDVHMTTQSECTSSSGVEGILMSSNTTGQTTTETQTTTTSFNLTSTSQDVSLRGSPEAMEHMDIQSAGAISEDSLNDRGLLSPVFSNSKGQQPLASSKEFWASVMSELGRGEGGSGKPGVASEVPSSRPGFYLFSLDDISFPSVDPGGNPVTGDLSILSPSSTTNDQPLFPQALSESDLLGDMVQPPTQGSSAPLLPRPDEDLTPKDDENIVATPVISGAGEVPILSIPAFNPGSGLDNTTVDVSSWVRDVTIATSESTKPHPQAPNVSYGAAPRNYMSPIPEASQELTSSMSQSNTNPNRFSGSHFRSVSPISERTSSSDVQRSVSPNLQSTRSTSEPLSTQQSGTSEQGSTGQGSSVLTAMNVGSNRMGQVVQTGLESGQTSSSGITPDRVSVVVPDSSNNTDPEPHQTTSNLSRIDRLQNEVVLDHVSTSSESCDVSLASSARAQVGGNLNERPRTPTPPHTSEGRTTPLQGRDYTPSSPHTRLTSDLHSSSESIERGNTRRVFRGKSPQSTNSAPAALQYSLSRTHVDHDTNSQRPLSPLATTAHRSTELLDTVGQTHESRQQVTQSADYSQQNVQNGRQANGIGMETEEHGIETQQPGIRPRRGSISRFRYSQQRLTDYPRSQQKISQDLEMMNLAISGMDFQSSQAKSVSSEPPLSHERRSPSQQAAQNYTQPVQNTDEPTRRDHRTEHAQRQPRALQRVEHAQLQSRNEQRSVTAQRQHQSVQRSRNELDSSRTFRPITPALTGTFRSASAPNSSGRDSPATPDITTRQASRIPAVQPSTRQNQSPSVPLPPQVPADSYDYLPPYSPPRHREGGTANESQQQQQCQVSEPGLIAEPPPSYDDIFGGNRERDGHRRRRRQERSRFSRRSTSGSRREASMVESTTGNDNETTQESSRPSSRQSSGRHRLTSLTNLFRRSRRHTHTDGASTPTGSLSTQSSAAILPDSTPRDVNDYTADWVASYNHTPRPFPTTRQENLAVRSTGSVSGFSVAHSNVSRTLSDTTNSRLPLAHRVPAQNPIPYRHPPPFPSAENLLHVSNTVSRSFPPPQHGSSQSLNIQNSSSRLPVFNTRPRNHRHGNTGENRPDGTHMPQQVRSQARPRPSSAYIATDVEQASTGGRMGSTHSTPTARARHLVTSGGMSNSCFDILAPNSSYSSLHISAAQTSAPHTPHSSTLHSSHSLAAQTSAPHTAHSSISHTIHSSTPNSSGITQPSVPHTVHRAIPRPAHSSRSSAPHTTQSSTSLPPHTTHSRIRGPRLGREVRGQGSTSSLNQQTTNLAINANTNNINATASPRASLTSSPVDLTPNRIESPVAFYMASSSTHLVSTGISNLIGSRSQEALEMGGSPTPVNSSPSTVVNGASNNTVVSMSDVREGSEVSGRVAMRQRAVNRRMVGRIGSSSDEDRHSSQMSNISQSSQRSKVKRRRRRRSVGSSSAAEVPSSLGASAHSETRIPNDVAVISPDQSHDQIPHSSLVSPDQSHDHVTGSHDNLDVMVDRMERVTEERETQSIEVTIESLSGESTPNHLRPVSKSCGHPCDSGDQVLCCLCTREQRSAAFPDQEHNVNNVLNSCDLCELQGTSTNDVGHSFHGNKHDSQRLASGEATSHRNRSGKNCLIM